MSFRLIALAAVILAFGVLSVEALLDVGFIGIFELHLASWAGMQVITDLVIVCGLAMIWMVSDSRTSGVPAWPFVILTLVSGSFGPLFYLVARELKAPAGRAVSA
ncbi:MAG: DUF2834 domain-containing protein [Parvibaculum sp.]|nr:DUF2834 domain-containing protein [Parvibaculum sp.]